MNTPKLKAISPSTTEEALKLEEKQRRRENKMHVYPKVKVRQQEEDQYDHHAFLGFSSTEKDVSPLTVARVPKVYVPNIVRPSISVAEGAKKANKVEEMNKQNIRACSIPPPRAVLSSPENDMAIGNKNRIKAQRPSAVKNHNLVQSSTQSILLHNITENSIKAKVSKGTPGDNCVTERKGSASKLTGRIQPSKSRKPSLKER